MDGRSGALEQDGDNETAPVLNGDEGARRGHPHRPRSRLRAVYFGVASFWGFVAGTAAVIAAAGPAIELSPTLLGILGGAAVVAIAGGIIVALAYREAAHRRGR